MGSQHPITNGVFPHLCVVCLLLLSCWSYAESSPKAVRTDVTFGPLKPGDALRMPGQYIAFFKDNIPPQAVEARARAMLRGRGPTAVFPSLQGFAFTADPTTGPGRSAIANVRSSGDVQLVDEDQWIYAAGAFVGAGSATLPTGVQRTQAAIGSPNPLRRTAAATRIAILDTGIDSDHPELNVRMDLGKNCIVPSSPAEDDNGHGTHVAGTAAAKGTSIVGVAPGTELIPVKVLDSNGGGSWSQIICGLDYIRQNRVDLNVFTINMSIAGSGKQGSCSGNCDCSSALRTAICKVTNVGITVVAAAGNSGTAMTQVVPATFPEVLSVTAFADANGVSNVAVSQNSRPAVSCDGSQVDDTAATFSNFATVNSDSSDTVSAPGVCILSTFLNGGYAIGSGTSMASPHVASAVALCRSYIDSDSGNAVNGPCSGKTPAQITNIIRNQASDQANSTYGFNGDPLRPYSSSIFYGYGLYAGV